MPLAEVPARAFLADASETKPSDAALIRDVCVALLRVGEGPVAGSSIAGGEGAAAAAAVRRAAAQPATAKTATRMEDPDDLRMLDWSERVGATLGVYTAGTAAEAVGVLGPRAADVAFGGDQGWRGGGGEGAGVRRGGRGGDGDAPPRGARRARRGPLLRGVRLRGDERGDEGQDGDHARRRTTWGTCRSRRGA